MKRLIVSALCLLLAVMPVLAEETEYFIICQPDSWVNVRMSPRKGAEIIGRYELGQMVVSDGKTQNGYMHLINLSLESQEGWVSVGFITGEMTIRTEQKAVLKNKVACRRAIGGTRRRWLSEGELVTVYAWSDEWAVTDHGFIMTEFLEDG